MVINGKAILPKDAQGKLVLPVDEKGNELIERDANGEPLVTKTPEDKYTIHVLASRLKKESSSPKPKTYLNSSSMAV